MFEPHCQTRDLHLIKSYVPIVCCQILALHQTPRRWLDSDHQIYRVGFPLHGPYLAHRLDKPLPQENKDPLRSPPGFDPQLYNVKTHDWFRVYSLKTHD